MEHGEWRKEKGEARVARGGVDTRDSGGVVQTAAMIMQVADVSSTETNHKGNAMEGPRGGYWAGGVYSL